jgi:hypothetical protein
VRHDQSQAFLSSLKGQFGEHLGYEFGTLLFEYWEAQRLYRLYLDLFGSHEYRTLMSSAWDGLAGDLQTLLHDSFVLTLCRLTDQRKSGKYESLTLETLQPHLPPELAVRFKVALDEARVATEFARIWRDKEIAHNDREHFYKPSGLAVTAGEDVKRALDSIAECLRFFDGNLIEPSAPGYGSDLSRYMRILKQGIAAEDQNLRFE